MKNFCKKIAIFLSVIALFQIFPVNAMVSITSNSKNVTSSTTTTNHSDAKSIPTKHGPEERLLKDEFGLNSFVFKAPDGTRTLQYFDHPVKYIDDTGNINDISLSVKPDHDNGYTVVSHFADISFPEKLKSGITASFMDTAITMIPITNNNASAFSTDEKIISYFSDKNTVYNYSVTYSGFKEDIVVNEFTGQTEYSFILKTGGLSLIQRNGSYSLTDNVGNVKAFVDEIIIFTADNRNNTYGNLIAETVAENDEYLMTILIDPRFLSDEKTAYPITIDPSISFNYAGDIDDITINSSDEDPNGSSGSIHCGYRNTYGKSRILMKFPNLSFSSIPSASSIVSATVEIRDLMCQSESLDIGCYRFTGNVWSESTATWNTVNANSYTTPQLSHNVISYSNGLNQQSSHRYSFDITSAVQLWYSSTTDKNKGLIFKSNSESTLRHKTFASYDRASNKPTLTIIYNEQEQIDISNTVLESDEIFMYPNEVKRIRILNMPSTCTAYFLPVNNNPDFYLENRNDGTCDVTALNLGYISIIVQIYVPGTGVQLIGICNVNSVIPGTESDASINGLNIFLKNTENDGVVDKAYPRIPILASNLMAYTWDFDIYINSLTLKYVSNGYYTISSDNEYLGINSIITGTPVYYITDLHAIEDEYLWSFKITASNNYRITPKLSSSRTLAIGEDDLYNLQNGLLQLSTYSNNSDYTDEWNIQISDQIDYFSLLHGSNQWYLDEIDTLIFSFNQSASVIAEKEGLIKEESNINEFLMFSSLVDTLSAVTHGNSQSILLAEPENSSDIILTTNDLDRMAPNGFSNIDLVYLGACRTSYEGTEEENGITYDVDISFARKFYELGAENVIAFGDSIHVNITETWTAYFFEEYYRVYCPVTNQLIIRSLEDCIDDSIRYADTKTLDYYRGDQSMLNHFNNFAGNRDLINSSTINNIMLKYHPEYQEEGN